MKKIFILLFALVTINFFCPVQFPSAMAEEIKIFTGKIDSVKRYFKSTPPKWEHAMVTIITDGGEKIVVYAVKATVVADLSGNDMCQGGKRFGTLSLKEGERVEVKYSTVKRDHNEAISIRCVPSDYVQQPGASTTQVTSSETPADTSGINTFVGKIESSSSIFHIPAKRKVTLVSDNGDKLTVFVSKEIAIRDMHAAPTRIGKRAEVKYSTEEDGENRVVSFRYIK